MAERLGYSDGFPLVEPGDIPEHLKGSIEYPGKITPFGIAHLQLMGIDDYLGGRSDLGAFLIKDGDIEFTKFSVFMSAAEGYHAIGVAVYGLNLNTGDNRFTASLIHPTGARFNSNYSFYEDPLADDPFNRFSAGTQIDWRYRSGGDLYEYPLLAKNDPAILEKLRFSFSQQRNTQPLRRR